MIRTRHFSWFNVHEIPVSIHNLMNTDVLMVDDEGRGTLVPFDDGEFDAADGEELERIGSNCQLKPFRLTDDELSFLGLA